MYLVNVLVEQGPDSAIPVDVSLLAESLSGWDGGLEHVSVSRDSQERAVLSLFIIAASVEAAERRALSLCRLAARRSPELSGLIWTGQGVAMVAQYYEQLFVESLSVEDVEEAEEGVE